MLRLLTLIAILLRAAAATEAACQIAITSFNPCSSTFVVGPWPYSTQFNTVLLNWTVTGTPTAPYTVSFKFGDAAPMVTQTYSGAGNFSAAMSTRYPTEFPFPVSATIDPAHVSGNTTPATATITKTFQLTPPSTPIAYYSPQTYFGSQTMTVPVLSGTVSKLVMMLGKPTSDTFQSVISDTATGPQTLAYPVPYPVFEKVMTNVAPGNYSLSQTFKVAVSNVATNLSLINTTWAQEDLAKQQLYHYAGPELNVETTDPTIIAFTNASLPPNYRTVLTPLQVAEKLFSAVVQAIAYKTPANGSAKVTLATKVGDCGSMTDLYNACLRVAGIPARTVCGWDNTNSTHCWTEMNFGGIGWIPADTSFARLTSPACTYMPFFGYLPTANQHCAVCRAGTLTTADMSTGAVQVGALSYTAGTPTPTVGPMTWNVILGTTPLP